MSIIKKKKFKNKIKILLESINLEEIPKDIVKKAKEIKHLVKIDYILEDKIHFIVKYLDNEHSVYFFFDRKKWLCDCLYFTLHLKPCKHIVACYLYIKEKS